MEPLARVAIVGYGLIGGSIGLALQQRRPQTTIVPLDERDDLSRLAGANLVILAAPVSVNVALLPRLGGYIPGAALVTDTGSTKWTTVAAAEVLPARLRFVGGHPIAGSAFTGFKNAHADLFEGRRWILTPTPSTRVDDVETLGAFVQLLGATPHTMDAEAHDHLFAFISHLPQLTASALMHVVGRTVREEGLKLAGAGLRDSTRLASSPPGIWHDVVVSNQTNITKALDALISALQYVRDHPRDIQLIFEDAAEWKAALEKSNPS